MYQQLSYTPKQFDLSGLNVAGFTPILVMDVREHAFLLDDKPSGRPKYIEAFFSNIAWGAVYQRLSIAPKGRGRPRCCENHCLLPG
ncbi:MAG: Fe-Mn family superoxide dismutase [Gammaproteobacteria bacterium]